MTLCHHHSPVTLLAADAATLSTILCVFIVAVAICFVVGHATHGEITHVRTESVNRAPCVEIGIDCAIGTDNLESQRRNTQTGQQSFALIEQ
ncbi:hypothetical protein BCAR13_240007 [Paraburkholderia caribensis]|nr:hypothetical protein BCAR13_240007 [Paraburkholderia caribensis]